MIDVTEPKDKTESSIPKTVNEDNDNTNPKDNNVSKLVV